MENVMTNNALPKRRKKSIRLGRVFIYVTLIVYSLFLMVPFYTIIISAFTDHAELDSALNIKTVEETEQLISALRELEEELGIRATPEQLQEFGVQYKAYEGEFYGKLHHL